MTLPFFSANVATLSTQGKIEKVEKKKRPTKSDPPCVLKCNLDIYNISYIKQTVRWNCQTRWFIYLTLILRKSCEFFLFLLLLSFLLGLLDFHC